MPPALPIGQETFVHPQEFPALHRCHLAFEATLFYMVPDVVEDSWAAGVP
jgi:hypothetical protein